MTDKRLSRSPSSREAEAAVYAALEGICAAAMGVPIAAVRGETRGEAHIALVRQLTMSAAVTGLDLCCTRVGELAGRDRTTVRHACRLIEDKRDDPAFDDLVSRIEAAAAEIARAIAEVRGALLEVEKVVPISCRMPSSLTVM